MKPEEFVRLAGYRWVGSPVVITTDLEELRAQIRKATCIIGHNITMFDLPAVFGVKSDEPLELAMQKRVYDTFVHGVLVYPAPYSYINRHGKKALAASPEQAMKWYGLDEQAYQLGVPGKTHSLDELAVEFGDPELSGKARKVSGYGRIPVDDERFREYLIGDVEASEAVGRRLLDFGRLDAYAWREQEIAARAAVISANGFRVAIEKAQARVDELAARREVIMTGLQENYGLPTEGKSPWATTAGKDAIMAALADHGITPGSRPKWTKTATGNLSLGGDTLIELTENTTAEELGRALAEVKGQRSLAQLALDSVHADGFCHPSITMLQRSGRWSTTKPGLTVWTSRGEGAVEKAYFIPDSPDDVLLAIDYSNADARAVAAMSGDVAYAERFKPGQDGHMINAIAAWGRETVATDPAGYRQRAKVPGHGWGYRVGGNTLSRQTGMPVDEAKTFLKNMNKAFGRVVKWQEACTREGRNGYVINDWGRKMWIEPGREYTQAPALKGQSVTREIVCDALLKMPIAVLRRVKAQVHDELIFSVPRENWEYWRDQLCKLMQAEFKPRNGGQLIKFPVSAGSAGENWFEATHE